ncbi:chaperone SicP [Vibrio caribbeanicus]|uniref:TIR chaperone family protein n=1 Tax=Vibrio caribbeanicus ATCC BAA-2122 TaxID=796620 RepID=E3BEK9_9VIBR|nr:chaperone SicP [Vibrio caribbeanicus]EFP98626.1 TIR chaperone family protein [Vibrio caribbeanicus ATCC BAA-2122]
MNHELLLSRLGEKLGLPLVFDQSNQCMLLLDDCLMVSILADEQDWLFNCMLTKVEPESEHRILKEAMRFNHILSHTGSGHIYFEENGRALLYQVRVENPQDGDEIFDQLTEVVNQYEKIHSDFH